MAAAHTIPQIQPMSDKARNGLTNGDSREFSSPKRSNSPMYIPPNEFRMKLLKRILSVDGNIDKNALKKLQRHSSERALQASILFQNGEVGTLISIDRINREQEQPQENDSNMSSAFPEASSAALPNIVGRDFSDISLTEMPSKKERPLKLPPIVLPPIHSVEPRSPQPRELLSPTVIPPPLTAEEWEELEDCRYLRPSMKKFNDSDSRRSDS